MHHPAKLSRIFDTTYLKKHAITEELNNLQSKQMQANTRRIENKKMKSIAIITGRNLVININNKFRTFT